MKKTIVLLPGDGIGPEVTRAAATVLRECAHEFHHQFDFEERPVGGTAIDVTATPLPNATLDACNKADAVFLGRSAERNGMRCRWASGRKAVCWHCGRAWGCM